MTKGKWAAILLAAMDDPKPLAAAPREPAATPTPATRGPARAIAPTLAPALSGAMAVSGNLAAPGSDSQAALTPEIERQRWWSVVLAGFLLGAAFTGITVVLPLYATDALQLSSAQYAHALSLRMAGITFGVMLLGPFSERLGVRRLTLACCVLGAICYFGMGFNHLGVFLVLMPLASAMISTTFVNLNHLTQLVSTERQGGANTAYRSAGLLGSIIAPLVATRLIALRGDYWPTFSAMGGCLLLAIIWLHRYPLAEPITPWRGWRAELAPMITLYGRALGEPRLMRAMVISTLFVSVAWAGVQSFFAIRLTRELGASNAAYGNYCAWASVTALLGVLGQGLWLDKVSVKRSVLLQYGGMTLGLVGMGLGDSPAVVAWSYILTALLLNSSGPPTSMWWSREAGAAGLSACFAVQKVVNAVALGAATWFCGWLVQHLTIAQVFLWSAAASLPLLAWLACLPDPTSKRVSGP